MILPTKWVATETRANVKTCFHWLIWSISEGMLFGCLRRELSPKYDKEKCSGFLAIIFNAHWNNHDYKVIQP